MQLMAHRGLLIHFHTFHEFMGHLPWAIRQNDGFGLKNLSEENLENAHQVSIFEHVQGGRKEVKKVITLFDAKIRLNCYF